MSEEAKNRGKRTVNVTTGEVIDAEPRAAAAAQEPIIAAEWRESELPLDTNDEPEPTAPDDASRRADARREDQPRWSRCRRGTRG